MNTVSEQSELVALLERHAFVPMEFNPIVGRCLECHRESTPSAMGAKVHRAHLAEVIQAAGWHK
jgi:hypothetical protein